MSDTDKHNWVEEPLSRNGSDGSCSRSAFFLRNSRRSQCKGLTEEAVEPLIKSDIETQYHHWVCSRQWLCAICDRLEERFFRKYGLNVKLNRKLAGLRLVTGLWSPWCLTCGFWSRHQCQDWSRRRTSRRCVRRWHRHGNAMTMNRAMGCGLRPWREYNGDLEAFGRDFRNYFDKLPAEQRVWAVVLSSAIYEYFVRYLSAAAGVDPLQEFRIIIVPPPQMVTNVRIERCKPTW